LFRRSASFVPHGDFFQHIEREYKMVKTRITLAISIVLIMTTQSTANNNYFIPGDAFFYFEIEQSEWKRFKDGQLTTLNYDRPDHLPTMLCGFTGYRKLDISNLPAKSRAQLVSAIETMKKAYPSEVIIKVRESLDPIDDPPISEKIEINKIRIFVYNKSFDLSKHRIGLKYNESWPETAGQFLHPKQYFQFDFFVNNTKGITESWRMGTDVAPLDIQLPILEDGYTKTPMNFVPENHKFVVAPPVPMETLCFPRRGSGLKCIVVSGDGVQTWMVDKTGKTKWKQTK
jgi:hypothetical protein